jgi:hypothetical protein
MKYVTGFLYFWYDFIVGDAWEIALGVVVTMAIIGVLIRSQPDMAEMLGPVLAAALIVITGGSLWWERRGRRL